MPNDRTHAEALVAPKPPALAEEVSEALQEKASLPLGTMSVLGLLAGGYIAFGALFATVALAGADGWPYGASQVLAGSVFTLGLVLVIVAGAELFTGNTLMAGLLVARRLTLKPMLTAWSVVYLTNFAGSLLIAIVALAAGVHLAGDGAVGRAALELAEVKSARSFGTAFASGILANMLVCLAVWIGYSARTTTDKVFAVLLPIAAFVAAGLEHSVANMYILPYGWMVKTFATAPFWEMAAIAPEAFPSVSLAGVLGNLVPVTVGNIVGGFLIASAYAFAYLRKPPA
ncbi:formate/nitrite transporter family protein [Rhodopseudomonas sp. NSM]|uniref:formate/nitrite transporter family protein n=1 Tax=Rhodopseudomonas sp. NSM TaxID=3457630 RepID=UPI0040364FCB